MIRQLIKLRNADWDAIIAGGAIRDSFHDKPITDVDIFVGINPKKNDEVNASYNSKKWLEYWFKMFNCNLDKNDDVTFFGGNASGGGTFAELDQNLLAVWQIRTAGKIYQVILIKKDPVAYVYENFDFGICRAYCDGRKMRFTAEFMQDSMNRTITLYPEHLTQDQISYALKEHIVKIQRKYPGWTPVLEDPHIIKVK